MWINSFKYTRLRTSFEGYIGRFQLVAVMVKAIMDITEQVFLWYDGVSFGYVIRSGIVGF